MPKEVNQESSSEDLANPMTQNMITAEDFIYLQLLNHSGLLSNDEQSAFSELVQDLKKEENASFRRQLAEDLLNQEVNFLTEVGKQAKDGADVLYDRAFLNSTDGLKAIAVEQLLQEMQEQDPEIASLRNQKFSETLDQQMQLDGTLSDLAVGIDIFSTDPDLLRMKIRSDYAKSNSGFFEHGNLDAGFAQKEKDLLREAIESFSGESERPKPDFSIIDQKDLSTLWDVPESTGEIHQNAVMHGKVSLLVRRQILLDQGIMSPEEAEEHKKNIQRFFLDDQEESFYDPEELSEIRQEKIRQILTEQQNLISETGQAFAKKDPEAITFAENADIKLQAMDQLLQESGAAKEEIDQIRQSLPKADPSYDTGWKEIQSLEKPQSFEDRLVHHFQALEVAFGRPFEDTDRAVIEQLKENFEKREKLQASQNQQEAAEKQKSREEKNSQEKQNPQDEQNLQDESVLDESMQDDLEHGDMQEEAPSEKKPDSSKKLSYEDFRHQLWGAKYFFDRNWQKESGGFFGFFTSSQNSSKFERMTNELALFEGFEGNFDIDRAIQACQDYVDSRDGLFGPWTTQGKERLKYAKQALIALRGMKEQSSLKTEMDHRGQEAQAENSNPQAERSEPQVNMEAHMDNEQTMESQAVSEEKSEMGTQTDFESSKNKEQEFLDDFYQQLQAMRTSKAFQEMGPFAQEAFLKVQHNVDKLSLKAHNGTKISAVDVHMLDTKVDGLYSKVTDYEEKLSAIPENQRKLLKTISGKMMEFGSLTNTNGLNVKREQKLQKSLSKPEKTKEQVPFNKLNPQKSSYSAPKLEAPQKEMEEMQIRPRSKSAVMRRK